MVLLAGGTGKLGRHVARELTARGYGVRRIVRSQPGPGDWLGDLRWAPSLHGAFDGVDSVISCAGAAMRLDNWRDRAGFRDVDYEGNRNLIEAANKVGVRKFVYVSLANGQQFLSTQYARAHEDTVAFLQATGLRFTVVRPTGLFSFFGEILRMARDGRGAVVGKGTARTNPIHDIDAARACVDALMPDERTDFPVGGPITYTRAEIVELAFRALGRTPAVRRIPGWAMAPVPKLLRVVNPRIAALVEFGIAVAQQDCLAPAYGRLTLDEYYRELVASNDQWRSPNQPYSSSATSK
jgi:uncharacterized protein YbjT (DUF2867 family)